MAEESIERRLVGGKWSTVARDESDAPDTWQKTAVHVTAAEIIAMETTDKVLVAAPDVNTVILPQLAVLSYRAGSVAYDYDPGLHVVWSTFEGTQLGPTTDVISTLTSQTVMLPLPAAGFGFFTDDVDPTLTPQGQALVLTAPNVLFTPPLGDGTIDMTVYYLSVSLLPV